MEMVSRRLRFGHYLLILDRNDILHSVGFLLVTHVDLTISFHLLYL